VKRAVLFSGCLTAAALAAAETGPPVRPLEIQDAVLASSFHVQGRLSFSPDGTSIAYTICDPHRTKADPNDKEGRLATKGSAYRSMGCDVWASSIADGKARNLTASVGNNWGPVWSPNGRLLVFYSDRGGRPQLWTWEARTSRVRLVSASPTRSFFGFDVPVWTPDSRHLIVRLRPEGMSDEELDESSPAGGDEPKEAGSTVVVYRSKRESGEKKADSSLSGLPLKTNLGDLSEIDVGTGKVRRLRSRVHVTGSWISPDGSRVAYLEMKGRRSVQAIAWLYDLVVYDLATSASRVAAADIEQGFGTGVSWSPDGQRLAYYSGPAYRPAECFVVPAAGGSPRKLERAETAGAAPTGASLQASDFLAPLWDASGRSVYLVAESRVWRGDVDSGRLSPVTPDLGAKVYEILQSADAGRIWSPDGGSLYVSRRDEKSKRGLFLKVNLAGGPTTPVLDEAKSYGHIFDAPIASPDGKRVVYFSQSVAESEDLWVAGIDFRDPHRLTTINPQLEKYRFGKSRLLDFTNADGQALHASLLLPADYEEGKRYPTLVFVYPQDWGSETVHQFGLGGLAAYNLHMLSTRGYAVLQPDVPVAKGSIMRDLLKSVMPAIDKAVEVGVVDPNRLAVTGQSAGGYATIAIVAQTTRFKAAIMNAGFGDLTGFYGSMSLATGDGNWIPWLETLTGGMGAGPWDAAQSFVQNSPIYFLNRVETPLIIQAGSADSAIVPFSDQVFVGLKRLGKDVTYLRYGGEGHVLAVQANLVDYWTRVIAFLDKHVKGAGGLRAGAESRAAMGEKQ
jgi:dipeptidyl aminopeptidase/acylaminoacyl peptidase